MILLSRHNTFGGQIFPPTNLTPSGRMRTTHPRKSQEDDLRGPRNEGGGVDGMTTVRGGLRITAEPDAWPLRRAALAFRWRKS
eukprot:3932183-Rhodomonas_salina.1